VTDDSILLASCLGDQDTGGGLVAVDGGRVEVIDRLSTTGLAVSEQNFFRLLRSVWHPRSPGELLVSDDRGVTRYFRLDEVRNAHDIYWDGSNTVIVSTGNNSIIWVNPSGEVVRRFAAPGEGDAWHLNSIVEHDGELYVSAFAQTTQHRGWEIETEIPSGIVFNLESQHIVLSGLARPHHPRFVDGLWVVCNSHRAELVGFDERTGREAKRATLASWTRGFAMNDDFLFVGESRPRGNEAPRRDSFDRARIAVLQRGDWKVVDHLSLPMSEVYDLVFVTRPMAEGIRTGFRTNEQRAAEQDQHAMFRSIGVSPLRLWAITDPLPADACLVDIAADQPGAFTSGHEAEVNCTITNRGPAILASVPPHPIHISYRWLDSAGEVLPDQLESRRSRLPRPIPPGETAKGVVVIDVTPPPGEYRLRVTLVQEFVAWFDELDAANAITFPVTIRSAGHSHSPQSSAN
jgi:acetolactate synthase-1/2/3 large subunit